MFCRNIFVLVLELILFHSAIAGKCSQECENAKAKGSYCCTCQRQLKDRGCYRNCWRTTDINCIRDCYTSLLMYDFDNFSCFGCKQFRNDTNNECLNCPSTCLSCLNSIFCLDCKKGFYGNACDKRCGHCQTFHDVQSECDINNGICVKGCTDGYYGLRCENKCGNCLPDDYNIVKCERDTGNCINGCAENHFGQRCNQLCRRCIPNDKGTVVCDRDTGFCLNNCTTGYFGNACNEKCNVNCLPSKKIKCDKVSGKCLYGCVPGWHGTNCEKPCKSTCLNRSCLQDSGVCSDGCVTGWYGDKCTKSCSSSCFNSTCLQTTGYCSHGCILGWYGKMCKLNCANTSHGNYCDRETSACVQGCDIGYTGLYCNMSSNLIPVCDSNQYIGGLVGVIITLILALIIWIIRRFIFKGKRCRNQKFEAAKNDESERNFDGLDKREANFYLELEAAYEPVSSTYLCGPSSNVKANCDSEATESFDKGSVLQTMTYPQQAGTSDSRLYKRAIKHRNDTAAATKFFFKGKSCSNQKFTTENAETNYDDIYNTDGLDREANLYLNLEAAYEPVPSTCLHELSSNVNTNCDSDVTESLDKESIVQTITDSQHAGVSELYTSVIKHRNDTAAATKFVFKDNCCSKHKCSTENAETNYDDIYNTDGLDGQEAELCLDLDAAYEPVASVCLYELSSNVITNYDSL